MTTPSVHAQANVVPPGAGRRLLARTTVREILMGAQDNLTNVLAVVLGVTIGAGRADFVALAGLSAGIAESVSMGGVLCNATRAEQDMAHRAGTPAPDADPSRLTPIYSGLVTFGAALVAGMVPLAPFALLPVSSAILVSMALSLTGLFVLGSVTGRVAGGKWAIEGVRLVVVAGIAAAAAAVVGAAMQVS